VSGNRGSRFVEQPTKFDFVINLKTASVLPQPILARADEIIE